MNTDKIRGELVLAKLAALEKIHQGHALLKAGEHELAQVGAAQRLLEQTTKEADVTQ
jgi:hypothetical protein